jgi:hypothetical protein
MSTLLSIIGILTTLGAIGCWIFVLIKMFNTEGALKGILGFICALYAFIWGWMNADSQGIRQIMLIWTGLIVAGFVFNGSAGLFAQ